MDDGLLEHRVFARAEAAAQLSGALGRFAERAPGDGGLEIVGLSGYGGTGKTFLLEAVLEGARDRLGNALTVSVDGRDEALLRDFGRLVDHRVAPLDLPRPARARHDYFPATRSLVARQAQLAGRVEEEVDAAGDLSDGVKRVAKSLYRLSPAVRFIPKAGPVLAGALKGLELVRAEEMVAPAAEALSGLDALREKRPTFGNPLIKRRFAALRHDPFEAFGDAYVSDLTAALSGYRPSDRWRLTHRQIPGLDRLLVVVDDFEVVGNVLGDFLVRSVFPRLKAAPFPSLVVVVGRDALYDAHPDFAHHLGGSLREQVRLQPFSDADARAFLEGSGYAPDEAARLAADSRGFPFILRLFADTRDAAERESVLFFRRFYERTTRWMTSEERAWLQPLSFLDEVNLATVEAMVPDTAPATVLEWFASEASVRDTAAPHFVVHPFIRYMLDGYYRRVLGSAQHGELVARAQAAMALA